MVDRPSSFANHSFRTRIANDQRRTTNDGSSDTFTPGTSKCYPSRLVRKELLIATNISLPPEIDALRRIASPWHTAAVLAAIGTLALRGWQRAALMHAMADQHRVGLYLRTIATEWLLVGLVLIGLWLAGSSVLTVLGERWQSFGAFFRDLGIGVVFLILSIGVLSMLASHRGAVDESTQFLLPHTTLEKVLWVALSISAGICEEAVFRGYLQKQFAALTKSIPAGIVLSASVFGAAHSYQGLAKALQIGVLGVLLGLLAYWRRSLRPGMISHTLQDVLGGFVRH